ncbi:hypothetical protein HPB50_029454 [Hyalomma asiaticum]|nr:hypothetical protein HPB50_029454 [Hyalomma asiaticum]
MRPPSLPVFEDMDAPASEGLNAPRLQIPSLPIDNETKSDIRQLQEQGTDGRNLGVEEPACKLLTGSVTGSACATQTSRTLRSPLCASGSAMRSNALCIRRSRPHLMRCRTSGMTGPPITGKVCLMTRWTNILDYQRLYWPNAKERRPI